MDYSFATPDKCMTGSYHSTKEIDIASAGSKLWIEHRIQSRDNASIYKSVAGAAFRPGHDEAGRMLRPDEKPPIANPSWSAVRIERPHRAEHTSDFVLE